jgi:hypothetical protein
MATGAVTHGINHFFSQQSLGARLLQSVVVLAGALIILYIFDRLVELASPRIAQRTETITTTENVLRLRRIETFVGLIVTALRVLVILGILFLVWRTSHHGSGPLALIGVGTVAVILASASVVPLLRDVTYGFVMIMEKWYGVGDHVVVEPFPGSGGVVEKVTLRSTKLRSVNGEAIWFHHQHVQGVRVTSAASHPLVVEVFVRDPDIGRTVVEDGIKIIPHGATTVPQPLQISEVKQIDDAIWRITAVCEVAPFREWIIDTFAVDVIQKTDQLRAGKPVIVHGPIVYYADATAEKRYRRSAKVRQRVRAAASR